ncbi:MAG: beta-galactosidase domain 4-containing protein, partial [Bacteroidaceae bacterium]
IRNRYAFLSLDPFQLYYSLLRDGQNIQSGIITLPSLAAGDSTVIDMPVATPANPGMYHLNLSLRLRKDALWAKAGHEVATDQIYLGGSPVVETPETVATQALKSEERDGMLTISGKDFSATFNKKNGSLAQLTYAGKNILAEQERALGGSFLFNGYRSISNDRRSNLGMKIETKDVNISAPQQNDTVVVCVNQMVTAGKDMRTRVPVQTSYRITPDGHIEVECSMGNSNNQDFVRMGLQAVLDKSLEQVEWLGRGPLENYPDRLDVAFVGRYQNTVRGMEEKYIKPQSMGERWGISWLTLTDKQGKGMRIRLLSGELGFSAQHYADEELWQAQYHHQLKNIFRPEVVLHLDAAMRGLGNASCGPGPLQKYELREKSYSYTFVIEPVK